MKAGGIICSTEATGHIDKIDYLHFDAEKFAELLVKECVATIANDTANYPGEGMMAYYQGVQDAVKSIQKILA